ncbi:hypothetical protein [Salinithrix halophila]|uniref:Uncharacterized protein n=1 Tax=Salinithrix halophila TaxID=1485204 RepID=A0ABV8JI13_9BACL
MFFISIPSIYRECISIRQSGFRFYPVCQEWLEEGKENLRRLWMSLTGSLLPVQQETKEQAFPDDPVGIPRHIGRGPPNRKRANSPLALW